VKLRILNERVRVLTIGPNVGFSLKKGEQDAKWNWKRPWHRSDIHLRPGSRIRAVVTDTPLHVMVRQPQGDVEALALSAGAQPETNERYY
jgi:hypothetical protein